MVNLDLDALPWAIVEGLEAMCIGAERMKARTNFEGVLPLMAGPFPRLPEGSRAGPDAEEFVNDSFFALEILAELRLDAGAAHGLGAVSAAMIQAGYPPPTYAEDPTKRQAAFRAILCRAREMSPLPAEELFIAGLRMMEWATQSVFGQAVLPDLGRWAIEAWTEVLAQQRFRLRNPGINVPVIETAIAADVREIDRLPKILAAARWAFNFNLGSEMRALLSSFDPR